MSEYTAESLLGLGRNFMESRILLSGVEFDLFTLLSDAPLTAEQAARKVGAELRPMTILLDALCSMDLLDKQDGVYQTPPRLAPLLSASSPNSILPMLRHSVNLWESWSKLTSKVRPNPGPNAQVDWLPAFIGAMHVIGTRMAAQIAQAAQPGGARKLLDIGGASGTYTEAFLRAAPDLHATLFDRPNVIEMARKRLGEAGVLDRVTLAPGDFYADPLPGGHDLALLSAIIHQNSPEQNVALYRKVHNALEPGGRLIVRDHVMSPDHTQPKSGAMFAVNMLVGTDGGGTYTFDEIRRDLEQAGFARVRLIQPDSRMDGLIEAFRL